MIKYWHRLAILNDTSLVKKAFSEKVNSDKNILESLPNINSTENNENTTTEPSIPENN